jgi:CBS domain containing-hemolysin-like protein
LDGLGGDQIARHLLWLANRPLMFVATALVGNNLANYAVSLAVVLGTQTLFSDASHWPELLMPLVVAPLVFIFGELMPKHVFYQAPNRMLRRCGPGLLVCTWLFLPISGLLWGLNKILHWFLQDSPQQVRLTLARRELEGVLKEGHAAGILRSAQRGLAQGLFAIADRPVEAVAIPAGRVYRAKPGMSKTEILRVARRHRLHTVPLEDPQAQRRLIGYLRVVELCLDKSDQLPPLRPLVDIPASETCLAALMRLHRSTETLGRVINPEGRTLGFVTRRHLSEALFRAS